MTAVALLQQQQATSVYIPRVLSMRDSPAGRFSGTPKGVILHGSRSGAAGRSTHDEFERTAAFELTNSDGLGWNATIGDDEIAIHLQADEWGHNAFQASRTYLAVEFAQPTVDDPIGDAQVRALCWWIRKHALARWPRLPRHFPTHAEVEHGGETIRTSGKTDVFPFGDPRADELRRRITTRLAHPSWTV